jgi:hypothetical protein
MTASGAMSWGTGAAAADTFISRTGIGALNIGPPTGSVSWDMGSNPAYGGSFASLAPHPAGAGNYILLTDGTSTFVGASTGGNITFRLNNTTTMLQMNASGSYFSLPIGVGAAPTSGTGIWAYIQAAAATDRPLVIRGAASQSADLLQVQGSSSSLFFRIASDGSMNLYNDPTITLQTGPVAGPMVQWIDTGYTGQNWALYHPPNDPNLYLRDQTNARMQVAFSPNPTAAGTNFYSTVTINAPSATNAVTLVINGAAGQSADLLDFKNSGGTVLSGFNSVGTLYMTGASGVIPLQTNVTGDAYLRFYVQNNGLVSWGPGNAQVDVGIQRYGASSIGVQPIGAGTGAFYVLNSSLYVGNAGDSYIRWNLAAGGQSIAWSSGSTAPDIQIARSGVGILRFSNPLAGGSSGDFSTQFVPNASSGGVGDNVLTLFRGTTLTEFLRFGAASGGGLLGGLNNTYTIDRVSSSAPTSRSLQFRRSTDGGVTFINDLVLDPSGNLTVGGNAGNFTISPAGGNATITLNPSSGYASGVIWATGSVNNWEIYQLASDPHLYFRDLVNARMQMTFTPGTTVAASLTEFNSTVQMDGTLNFGAGGPYINTSGAVLQIVDTAGNIQVTTPSLLVLGPSGSPNLSVQGTNPIISISTSASSWYFYTAGGTPLYFRDMINARMHMTFTPGASVAAALTEFNSGVQVDGTLSIGGVGSFDSGAGPMLFLANDTGDPTGNPTGGTLIYSSAGVLKARTPDGTVTQIAPRPVTVPGKYAGTLAGTASPETVTHNLNTRDVLVQVINGASPYTAVEVDWAATTVNTVTVNYNPNLGAGWRVVVMG